MQTCPDGSADGRTVRRIVVVALALLSAGPAVRLSAAQQRAAYEELQIFSAALQHIRLNYVDSVSYSALVPAAIRGVLRSLDPHSYYLSRIEFERRNALERGELVTVGISLEEVDGVATILGVAPRSASARAGILPGDRVLALNDTAVAGLDMQTLQLRLAGEKGSRVRLRLERGPRFEPDTFSVTLRRAPYEFRSVSVVRMADSITGYLRLEEFGEKASEEVHDALRRLRGMRARQVILDLRGNPGGLVIASVEIASEFLPKNTVVFRTRGRKRDVDTTFVTKRDGDFRDLPLIVLIDPGSASASEALAGTLQDHDRALLMGRRSFGKALMQTVFFLPSGDNIWLTIGYVQTPSGRVIQRRYRGLGEEQYRSFAGRSGAEADTLKVYFTDAGRPVRGGGGIVPDVLLPPAPTLPVWFTAASDSGLDTGVADSVAQTLAATPAARSAWRDSPDQWRDKLLAPFLGRVRSRLHVAAPTDTALDGWLARILAGRAAEVRWGPEAREEFEVRNSRDIRAAIGYFPRLRELLAPVAR